MRFKQRPKRKLKVIVKGLFQSITPIPYVVNLPSGDWTSYFSIFEQQSWGQWDSDSCWMLSSINCVEAQLNFLFATGAFSINAKNFFVNNGFCTALGIFSLSEQFHEILCRNGINGGEATEAWQSFQMRGFIPRSMLCYSMERAQNCQTEQEFENDYFNPSQVTQAMLDLGQQSLKYINIAYQRTGTLGITPTPLILSTAFKQAPPNLGIPVDDAVWNELNIPADTDTTIVHEVAGLRLNADGSYGIADQYIPFLKTLAAGYFIGACLQGIITAVPEMATAVPQPIPQWKQFVMNLWADFNGNPLPFPNVPVGS